VSRESELKTQQALVISLTTLLGPLGGWIGPFLADAVGRHERIAGQRILEFLKRCPRSGPVALAGKTMEELVAWGRGQAYRTGCGRADTIPGELGLAPSNFTCRMHGQDLPVAACAAYVSTADQIRAAGEEVARLTPDLVGRWKDLLRAEVTRPDFASLRSAQLARSKAGAATVARLLRR
jgi:hypothetical protein